MPKRIIVITLMIFYYQLIYAQSGYFKLIWDNDLLYFPANTDHYYSNGMAFSFSAPTLKNNPINHLLLKGKSSHWENQFHLNLRQNLYTPKDKKQIALVSDDRPFASFLIFDFGSQSLHRNNGQRINSNIQLGILGRYAGGGKTQNFIHKLIPPNEEFPGWQHEVKPDVIINYNLSFEQALVRKSVFNVWAKADARLGTLHTDLTTSLHFGIGNEILQFSTPSTWQKSGKFRFSIYGDVSTRLIAHNATLTGGLVNKDERYAKQIIPIPYQLLLGSGVKCSWKNIGLQSGIQWSTAAFRGGLHHGYGYLEISYLW